MTRRPIVDEEGVLAFDLLNEPRDLREPTVHTFSPPGTTLEREEWAVSSAGVTHLRLRILPDKSGNPCRATLISLALR